MSQYRNKYGYFREEGREYAITRPDTPKPWVNIMCPGDYGMVISQAGGGYSWLKHAQLNRVTRWQQDLLKDDFGKYIYIKDAETGALWSPTWQPVKAPYDHYLCVHGIGYTVFEYETGGIRAELTVFVPPAKSMEVWSLKIKNLSGRKRTLEVYSYLEWCLDAASSVEFRELHNLFIETGASSGTLTATKRVWAVPNEEGQFFNREWEFDAFHSGWPSAGKYQIDREKFIGRYGSLQSPAMTDFKNFGEKETYKWKEPMGGLMWEVGLSEDGEAHIEIFTGIEEKGKNCNDTLESVRDRSDELLEETKKFWEDELGKTGIVTPDAGVNYMMNWWLKYQAVSSRINGRTGYYQAGGAYGFRDQLQDSQIFFKLDPPRARGRILDHASRQFTDGAVQHWWHPISDQGLRNRISDNLLWLPFITQRYLMETDDWDIMNEQVSYLDDRNLKDSLKTHCEKAIERVWGRRSPRGLPIIGEGDWNDGMSVVGWEEKGESVWLGHFLAGIMAKWSALLETLGESEKSEDYRTRSDELKKIINDIAWEDDRYIRATTDSGKPLGSKSSKYGKVFLNAQTWAILHKIAPEERIPAILETLEKNLYREYGPILFHPAYGESDPEVGYLSRYAPGARENGGLYFHAGCWAVAAECEAGRPDVALRLIDSFLPPNRSLDPDLYYAEPYVLPGNVDGPDSERFGRGAFTWYTGSAAWLYTIIWDWMVGLMPEKDGLRINPCIPSSWGEVSGFRYFRGKKIEFTIRNTGGPVRVSTPDGVIEDGLLKPSEFSEPVIKLEITC